MIPLRQKILVAIFLSLTMLALISIGSIWAQNHLLQLATMELSHSPEMIARDKAQIARSESLDQLKKFAISKIDTQESTWQFVQAITSNIQRGILVSAAILLLLFVIQFLLFRQLWLLRAATSEA